MNNCCSVLFESFLGLSELTGVKSLWNGAPNSTDSFSA
jgi:hypothetical protein